MTDKEKQELAEKIGHAYGAGSILGRRWIHDNPPLVLVFDELKTPSGFRWVTRHGEHVLYNELNKTEFRELSRQKAKKVCKGARKAVMNAKSEKEVLSAVRSAAKAIKGYVTRTIDGHEYPIVFKRNFSSEIGKQFAPGGKETKDLTLEQLKQQGLDQLDAMSRIPKLLKRGGVITPAKGDWNIDKDHKNTRAFYVVGAKIQQYPSGLKRIILDLYRDAGDKNSVILAYNLTFTNKAGFETKRERMLETANKVKSSKTIDFFAD